MIVPLGAFLAISVSIAAGRRTSGGAAAMAAAATEATGGRDNGAAALLARCAARLLDASKDATATASAVFVSASPEAPDELRAALLHAVHRGRHAAVLVRRFDVSPFDPRRHTAPHAYLVAARGASDLAGHLDAVNATAGSWRPEADFVLVLREAAAASLEPVGRRLWANSMLRSVLLVPSSSAGGADAFAWYPFRDGGCGRVGEPVRIGACGDGRWDAGAAFGGRVPRVFAGCAVTVAGFHWPPMTVLARGAMSSGMDVETVRLMGRVGNVTPAFREVAGGRRWGVKSPDGTWDGGFGELAARRADVLIGGGIMTAERLEMFDCAATRQVIQFPIYTPPPTRLPYWRNMLNVFSASFWLTLSAAFLLTATVVRLSGGARPPAERPAFADCGYCLVAAWAVLCSVAAGRQPATAAARVAFLAWTVYVLHVSAVYTSAQLVYLYRPRYERPMRTVADIRRSGLTVCAVHTFIPIAHAMDPANFNLTDDYAPCADVAAAARRLLCKKDIAILDPEDHFEALVPGATVRRVNRAEEMVIVFNIGVFARKGCPYMAALARAQRYAYETGLHNKWRKDASPPKRPKKERLVKVKKLNADELQGAFIILACGLCVGLVVFLIEWLWHASA